MRKLELCVSATLLCVEQDERVLFLMEQEFSGGKDNTVIRQYCRGSN